MVFLSDFIWKWHQGAQPGVPGEVAGGAHPEGGGGEAAWEAGEPYKSEKFKFSSTEDNDNVIIVIYFKNSLKRQMEMSINNLEEDVSEKQVII